LNNYITLEDILKLFRPLKSDEAAKAENLIPVVCDSLRQEAKNIGKDLDKMLENKELQENVLKSVCVDVIGRALMTSTDTEPLTQVSQSALGYSVSGTFLVPGGGLFIKKSELARLGLRRQRYGVIEFYGND
jgi:hypothetical protein